MAVTDSPLRYPGGKTSLFPLVKSVIEANNGLQTTYVEPFVGGAGLALKLLFDGAVKSIAINDIDPAIYSFWHCVLTRADELCEMVETCDITVAEWKIQKEVWENQGYGDLLAYGFATLFLNRTNVSGVLKGGIIGGEQQTGNYKIDARFKRQKLIDKIQRIYAQRDRILLFNLDVIDFVTDILPHINGNMTFTNYDPPYVKKGKDLYVNFYTPDNHMALGRIINKLPGQWMVTYDDCGLIRTIYENQHKGLIPITYSAGTTKATKEIAIFSPALKLPEGLVTLPGLQN